LFIVSASVWKPAALGAVIPRSGSGNATAASVRIAGVSYTEAKAWLARLGYKVTYNPDKQVLSATSAAGRIELRGDSREASVFGVRVFMGEPATLHKGVLMVSVIDAERFLRPMLQPSSVTRRPLRTIVIDPGHGGNDSGTQNKPGKIDEKVMTLDVAKRLQGLLTASGYRVLMTRTDDRFVELPARAEIANKAQADLFISIHFNAVASGQAVRGTETYVLTPQNQRSTSSAENSPADKELQPGNRHDAWNAVLGWQLHRKLLGKLKTEDRGYKRARFAVLRLVECPGVLVEAGYLSNDAEARRIATPGYRGDIAEAIAAGVEAYAAAVTTAK
jgi:N-acetylmuramoyl-L-alanine amidase